MDAYNHRVLSLYFANLEVNQIADMMKGETKYSIMHRINIHNEEYVKKVLPDEVKQGVREGLKRRETPPQIARVLGLRPILVYMILRRLGWSYAQPVVLEKFKVRCENCGGQYLKTLGSKEPCPYCEYTDANSTARKSNHRTDVRSREDREYLYPRQREGQEQTRDSEVYR